jgi:flagellar basal body-associated protein FliL
MARTKPKKRPAKRRKKKPKAQDRVSFTLVLLTLMIIVALASGMAAYMFGQRALEGVKPVPAGKQVPQPIPTEGSLPGNPTSGLNFSKAING